MRDLLLLHGAIGSKAQLEPLSSVLSDNFTVHSINFAGHGGEPFNGDFSIEAFADDVLRYLDSNGISSIDIFGYSMGGYVALWIARHYPERTGRIFTLATKFEWTPAIAYIEISKLDANKISEKVPAFARMLEERHRPNDWKKVLEQTALLMTALGDENPLTVEDCAEIGSKVRVGVGDNDAMVTIGESTLLFKSLADASFVVFPDTPHPIERISLDRLVWELKDFFLPAGR